MKLIMLKSKIHRARLTGCNVAYEGSLEIDMDILKAAEMYPYEKILVVNVTNGERLETYTIPGKAGSRTFMLNGAAAHRGKKGDIITIMTFCLCSKKKAESLSPKVLVMDKNNNIIKIKRFSGSKQGKKQRKKA